MLEKTKELLANLWKWRRDVNAQMSTLNPSFDADRVNESMLFHDYPELKIGGSPLNQGSSVYRGRSYERSNSDSEWCLCILS